MNNQEILSIDQVDQGITEITVQGFKSLYEESRIEIRPLTILAGANSSGKSSIMQPLLLMKQTLEAPYDPGGLLLNGANVKFTKTDQVLSHKPCIYSYNAKKFFKIKITFTNPRYLKRLSLESMFIQDNTELNIYKEILTTDKDRIVYNIGMSKDEAIKSFKDYVNNWKERTLAKAFFLADIKNKPESFIHEIEKNRCFLRCAMGWIPINADGWDINTQQMSIKVNFGLNGFNNQIPIDILSSHIRRIIHVPGLRGTAERSFLNISTNNNQFLGRFDNYFASIIYNWHVTQDPKIEELNKYLQFLGLTSKVTASRSNDIQIELQVGLSKDIADTVVNIADVGLGVSQVLPVLVALLVAEPGQLVYLEQPELHLHPRAQANLAQPLIDAANRGVKVVVETHSDLLLTRIQTLVAEEAIDPAKLILHWFSRGDDGMTKIASAELDQAGAYGDFPIDFNDVAFKEDLRYVEAAESQLIKK
jgi:predicted ATPase